MNRRRLLRGASVVLAGAVCGCSSSGSGTETRPATPAESPTRTPRETLTATDRPTGTDQPTTRLAAERTAYVSEVRANPEGPDAESLGAEYVLVETHAETTRDFSGYTLSYGTRREYVFPDLVSAVEPGASLELVTGAGTDGVDDAAPPTYRLFVGSESPLLDNDGMRLALRDATGAVVDSVEYGPVPEGGLYARPET